ncbi:MAG: MarR family winged helix-turn-helix transcriptional regulator [Bacillota bacterium]
MNENKSIGRWISVLHRLGQIYLDRELQPFNLSSGQIIFLLALFKEDGVSQEKLATFLCIDKGTTARAIAKLEEAGFVNRQNCPLDKRINKIFLTEKSLEIKPKLLKIINIWTTQLTKDFSEEEKGLILSLLNKMAYNAVDYLKRE